LEVALALRDKCNRGAEAVGTERRAAPVRLAGAPGRFTRFLCYARPVVHGTTWWPTTS